MLKIYSLCDLCLIMRERHCYATPDVYANRHTKATALQTNKVQMPNTTAHATVSDSSCESSLVISDGLWSALLKNDLSMLLSLQSSILFAY
jgi:hypothetical protein